MSEVIPQQEAANLDTLIEEARNRQVSPQDREAQMLSYVWGQLNLSGCQRTREQVRKDLGYE